MPLWLLTLLGMVFFLPFLFLFLLSVLEVLGIEPKVSPMLGKSFAP